MILSNGKAYQPEGYDYGVYPDSGQPFAISRATGEVTDAITITVPVGTVSYTPEQQKAIHDRKEQQKGFLDRKAIMDSFGRFSFLHTAQGFEDVSPETAARLVYLSTFLKWEDGALLITQRSKMSRDSLQEVLGLSRQTVSRFLDEVNPNYITLDDVSNLYMNPKLFYRGKIGRHGESVSWRKIYTDSVRKLYRMAGKNNHRYLGYVFKMLPFINIEYNGLCLDIFEKDLALVQFITDADFCNKIGYDYSAVSRLKKVYKRIRFDVEGHTEPFCAFVEAGNSTRIFVNPHILYNGTRPDMVAVLGSFCNSA